MSGWFIESLSGAVDLCAERKAQAEGRLYSFQAQKLNLISNINLFSLRSLSSRSFPSICRARASYPAWSAPRLHYTRPGYE